MRSGFPIPGLSHLVVLATATLVSSKIRWIVEALIMRSPIQPSLCFHLVPEPLCHPPNTLPIPHSWALCALPGVRRPGDLPAESLPHSLPTELFLVSSETRSDDGQPIWMTLSNSFPRKSVNKGKKRGAQRTVKTKERGGLPNAEVRSTEIIEDIERQLGEQGVGLTSRE